MSSLRSRAKIYSLIAALLLSSAAVAAQPVGNGLAVVKPVLQSPVAGIWVCA